MIRFITLLCAAIALSGAAFAADLPPAPPVKAPAVYVPPVVPVYNWAGVYLGINGGWSWENGKFTFVDTAFPGGFSGTANDNVGGARTQTLGSSPS